jgi:hypothetical protein
MIVYACAVLHRFADEFACVGAVALLCPHTCFNNHAHKPKPQTLNPKHMHQHS